MKNYGNRFLREKLFFIPKTETRVREQILSERHEYSYFLLKRKASLFAFGSFGYFFCKKYQNEFVSHLDSVLGRNDGSKIFASAGNIGYYVIVTPFLYGK